MAEWRYSYGVIEIFKKYFRKRGVKKLKYHSGFLTVHSLSVSQKPSLFVGVMQPRFVVIFRRFGTTYRFRLQGSSFLKTEPILCPETSVNNYHSTHCVTSQKNEDLIYTAAGLKLRLSAL